MGVETQTGIAMGLAKLDCLSFNSPLCNFLFQLVSLHYALGMSIPNIISCLLESKWLYHCHFGESILSIEFKFGSK